jgi:hypothetical protein
LELGSSKDENEAQELVKAKLSADAAEFARAKPSLPSAYEQVRISLPFSFVCVVFLFAHWSRRRRL